jgi:hypothetical protein
MNASNPRGAQEVVPNVPATGTGTQASSSVLVLDTEAGSSDAENYTLTCTRHDHTAGAVYSTLARSAPLDSAGAFAVAQRASGGATDDFTFHASVPIPVLSRVAEHAFSCTIALVRGGSPRPLPGTRDGQPTGISEIAS